MLVDPLKARIPAKEPSRALPFVQSHPQAYLLLFQPKCVSSVFQQEGATYGAAAGGGCSALASPEPCPGLLLLRSLGKTYDYGL